jgi:transcriptional regulator with XRE-family HTH domain
MDKNKKLRQKFVCSLSRKNKEVAAMCGVSAQAVSAWKKGKPKPLELVLLRAWAILSEDQRAELIREVFGEREAQ